ncbi:hypothetical protein AB0F96_10125 [Streptomyces sp. NPDC023998]
MAVPSAGYEAEATLLIEDDGALSDRTFPEIPTSAVTIGKDE